ncbi:hypothetical protein BMS3Bbin10_02801 [bacterium BMS3Bbin10]|nr:hypothetical protein BMS3Bbin10_02801 [bacterium BMS3Bbin10]
MQNSDKFEDMRDRLQEFSARLEKRRAQLASRPHHKTNQHMGHLVEFEKEHQALTKRMDQTDASVWEQMGKTYRADLNGLMNRFDKWVRYVDEEYKQTS